MQNSLTSFLCVDKDVPQKFYVTGCVEGQNSKDRILEF
jgi:hypothetical protein